MVAYEGVDRGSAAKVSLPGESKKEAVSAPP